MTTPRKSIPWGMRKDGGEKEDVLRRALGSGVDIHHSGVPGRHYGRVRLDNLLGGEMSRVPGYLKFKYTNWRGDDHEYILEPEPESLAAHDYPLEDGNYEFHWNLSGEVITRDGDPRDEMGDTRRRSFVIASMREIEESPWFPPLHYDYDPGDEPAVLCKMCEGAKVISTG